MRNYALQFSMLVFFWSVCTLPGFCQEFLNSNSNSSSSRNAPEPPFLQNSSTALLAPNCVNNQEIPTIPFFNYGFGPGHELGITPIPQPNQYGTYAQYELPTTGTGAVNLNTVDGPTVNPAYLAANAHGFFNPARNLWINLAQTASAAEQFIDSELPSNSGDSSNNTSAPAINSAINE